MIKGIIKNILDIDFNIQLPQKYVKSVNEDWHYLTIGGVGSVIRQIHNQLKKAGKMSYDKIWVRTESYSGGNSVRIYLHNPSDKTYDLSKSIMNIFQYGQFNGMIDLYENSPSETLPILTIENGVEIEVASKYNFTQKKPPFGSVEYEMYEGGYLIENKYDCNICKDDGRCLNSPSHPQYEKYYDEDDWLDYLSCWGYIKFHQPKEYQKHLDKKYEKVN